MILWKELFLARPYLLFVHTYSMKSYIHKTSHSGVHLVCIVQFSKVTRRLATRLSYRIHLFLSTSFSLFFRFIYKKYGTYKILYVPYPIFSYSSISTIFDGFIILFGSRAFLMALIILRSPSGVWRLNSFNFLYPTPCSPDILPPKA